MMGAFWGAKQTTLTCLVLTAWRASFADAAQRNGRRTRPARSQHFEASDRVAHSAIPRLSKS